MRFVKYAAAAILASSGLSVVSAQILEQQAEARRQKKEADAAAKNGGGTAAGCANGDANREAECIKALNAQATARNKSLGSLNAALTAGNAKMNAQDYDGAIAAYQGGVAAAPTNPNVLEFHNAIANAYRARATKNFNAAVTPGMTQLPPAVLTSVGSDLQAALNESGEAYKMAGTDAAKTAKIGTSVRETEKMWVQADRAGVLAAPVRPTLDMETTLFNQWAPTATPQQLVQYTPGIAYPLLAKDKEAALKLAEDMYAKSPTDTDATIAYAQIVSEAKLPATDPRRVKAKAAVESMLTTGTTNDQQKIRLRNARIKLNAAT